MKPGATQRPARSTVSGLGSEVSCTPTPPATRSPAIQSDETVGSDGSSVRIVPLLEDHAASLVRSYRSGGFEPGLGAPP